MSEDSFDRKWIHRDYNIIVTLLSIKNDIYEFVTNKNELYRFPKDYFTQIFLPLDLTKVETLERICNNERNICS